MKNFISKWRYCGIKKQTQQCSSWEVKINLWEESTQKLYYFVLNCFFFFFMKYKPKQLSLVSYILWRAIADMVWWTDGRWVYGQMGTCPTDKGGLSLNGNFWVSVVPLLRYKHNCIYTGSFSRRALVFSSAVADSQQKGAECCYCLESSLLSWSTTVTVQIALELVPVHTFGLACILVSFSLCNFLK